MVDTVKLIECIQEFVPCGGLRAWKFSLKFDGRWVRMRAEVPDADSGRPIPVQYVKPIQDVTASAPPEETPRECVRRLVREFVLHEADESIGFRGIAVSGLSAYLAEPWSNDKPMKAPVVRDVQRPFDPHHEER